MSIIFLSFLFVSPEAYGLCVFMVEKAKRIQMSVLTPIITKQVGQYFDDLTELEFMNCVFASGS